MTLDQLKARLQAYLDAEAKILEAQEYTMGQGSTARRLTRANLGEVQQTIARLRAEIVALEPTPAQRRRIVYLRPY